MLIVSSLCALYGFAEIWNNSSLYPHYILCTTVYKYYFYVDISDVVTGASRDTSGGDRGADAWTPWPSACITSHHCHFDSHLANM